MQTARFIVVFLLAALAPAPLGAGPGDGAEPVEHTLPERLDDYQSRTLAGFPLRINSALIERDPALLARVLVMLESDLLMMQAVLPEPAFERLRSTTIWIELQGAVVNPGMSGRGMCYHASREWVTAAGLLPDKAGGVEICRAQDFIDWRRNQPFMTLHEFAHAWHHIIGADNPEIEAAYEHARDAGLYDRVMHNMQTEPVKAYAMNNATEYFSELSEAYFGLNDFQPFTRGQLAAMDPQGLRVVAEWWNKEAP